MVLPSGLLPTILLIADVSLPKIRPDLISSSFHHNRQINKCDYRVLETGANNDVDDSLCHQSPSTLNSEECSISFTYRLNVVIRSFYEV